MFRFFRSGIQIALLGAGLFLGVTVPLAHADACDAGSIVPADNSFSYSTLPFCDGNAVLVPTAPGAPYGYTRPGNTAFVNGQPQITPYSNVSFYTVRQAADQRALGNLSATSIPYSSYGGATTPGQTATRETTPSYTANSR